MPIELLTPPVTASSSSWDGLRQMVEDHREQAEEGHERLRRDFRGMDDRIERLEHDHMALIRRIDRMESQPVNVEKMSWTTKQLAWIVSSAVVLAGGMWQLHSDMATATKLQDERYTTQNKIMEDLGKELQLRRLEIKDLSEKISSFQLERERAR